MGRGRACEAKIAILLQLPQMTVATQVKSSPSWLRLGGDFLALRVWRYSWESKEETLDGTALPCRFSAFQLKILHRITALVS